MEEKFDQQKYINGYVKNNYDSISLRFAKGTKAKWQERAKNQGLSLTQYLVKCVEFYEENKS